jgi:putative transposase
MPRASDYLLQGYTYHLTHRCQEKLFLLKAGRDRDAYRKWLREGVDRYGVPVYGYCITHNHVHVVAHASDREAVSRMMQLAAGATAKGFNIRKDRENAMWEHPYHCTIIQGGRHLLNCLRYIDLNMVRAGRVAHPGVWRWCGYDELVGRRKRYRILNIEHLVEQVGMGTVKEFHEWYANAIQERLAATCREREPHWTASLAVGDEHFVAGITREYRHRSEFETAKASDGTWAVRESPTAYTVKMTEKTGANDP